MSVTYTITTDPSAPVCAYCGELVESISRDGWVGMAHRSGDVSHTVGVVYPPRPVVAPVVRIVDHGGHLAVSVDRGDDRGDVLVLTTPTHRGAVVVAAQVHGWAEAIDRARGAAARYVGDVAAWALPIETRSLVSA